MISDRVHHLLRHVCIVALLSLALHVSASDSIAAAGARRYIPQFHGTIRALYRQSTEGDGARFEIANARMSASGFVAPWLDYFMQVDLCERGKVKILDAFIKVYPTRDLTLYIGQMRVPFSMASCRLPWKYYFADVELVARYGSLRDVGFKAGYTVPGTALYAEGGVFNASDMSDHSRWDRSLTYAVKANYALPFGLKPELAFMSRRQGGSGVGVRVNQYDVAASYSVGRFFAEAEYICRTYAGRATCIDADGEARRYGLSHAYSIFADYSFPVRSRMADAVSVQARYDGLTDASTGVYSDGYLVDNIPAMTRTTVGVTASRTLGAAFFAFRINYEYIRYRTARASGADGSQLIAGVTLHF